MGSRNGKSGGGRSSSPTEIDNTLRSRDTVTVLYALAEGECQGFPTADHLKHIYLDDTPIQNADGSYNFTNFTVDFRTGTADQSPIPGSNRLEKETQVAQIVRNGAPVTRSLTELDAEAVKVRIGTDAWFSRDAEGNVGKTKADFIIQISGNGGPFINKVSAAFDGKSSGAYQREYIIPLDGITGPWRIRVLRNTVNSSTVSSDELEIRDDLFFSAFTKIKYTDSAFPGVATARLTFDSEQFRSNPTVSFDWLGFNQIHVPQNYDAITKTYSGLFNGVLKKTYSTNPAWALWEVLTNPIWGFNIPAASLDIYSFYSLGQHCDELVPNGEGGQHPRFQFDERWENTGDQYEVMKAIASSMNAQFYEQSGSIVMKADTYDDYTQVYGPANVIEGVGEDGRLEKSPFIYSTAKEVDRYTAVLVRWFNPELNGQEDFELIEDEPAIAKYGYNVARIDAHGCTRRAGAIRKGRHFLFASLFQDDFIQFSVPDGGALINPAEVALVQDGDESNRTDLFGRFATINEASVQLDRAVSFNAGEVCQLVTAKNDRKVTKEFTASFTEDTQELFILYDEADRPEPNDFWLLSIVGTEEGERWRILSVSENDDEDITYTIEGIIQPLNKQPFIENFLLSDKSYGITQAITDPGPPVNLRAIEGQVSSSVGIQNQIELLWAPPQTPGVRRYEVQYKTSNEANWISDFTTANSYLIKDVTLGSFDFRVRTVSITESVSEWATAAASIIGLAGPPRDIEEFSLVAIENHMVLLKWKQSSDLDVREGGYLQINHSTADPGEWHKSVVLIEELSGVETECSTALKNGTYLIKAFDSSGKESQNAAAVTTNIDDETLKNFVRTESEAADGFPGTQTNMLVDAFGNLTLSSVGTIGAYEGRMRDIPNMGQFGVSDTPDIASTGEYECQAVELGGKYSSRIRVDVDFSIFAVSENIGDLKIRMRDIKAGYFQVDTRPSGIDALIKIRSRNDGVWGPYESFIQNGEYLGDAHQPKVTFLSKDPLLNVEVSEILTVIDIPDRNEVGEVVTSETAPVDITFKRPYFQMPIIVVSIVNQAANDRYLITNESATGFSLECLNGADARIARVLRWTASGPGRQLP